jgi:GNAT superfamily N-acetyltransferase
MLVEIRDYEPADEQGWLRCRVLSFLGTAYFDDVMTAKEPPPPVGAELVAVQSGVVIGLLDLQVDGDLATVTTIAVHPDCQRQGVGAALLETACARAKMLGTSMIDAWTRDDDSALSWYRISPATLLHSKRYRKLRTGALRGDRPQHAESLAVTSRSAPLARETGTLNSASRRCLANRIQSRKCQCSLLACSQTKRPGRSCSQTIPVAAS